MSLTKPFFEGPERAPFGVLSQRFSSMQGRAHLMLANPLSSGPPSRAQATAVLASTDVTIAGTSPPTFAVSSGSFSGGPASSPGAMRRSDPRYP